MSTDYGFYCQQCKTDCIIDECRWPESCERILKARAALVALADAVPNAAANLDVNIDQQRVPFEFFMDHRYHDLIVVTEYYAQLSDQPDDQKRHRWPPVKE